MRFPPFLLLALTVSCSSGNDRSASSDKAIREMVTVPDHNSPPDPAPTAAKAPLVKLSARIYEQLIDHETYFVELTVDGHKQVIDTVMACETIPPSDFGQYDIPATAVTACGGWFAGAGDYFYAIVRNGKVLVYQGWQDEQQEGAGFHWKQMR